MTIGNAKGISTARATLRRSAGGLGIGLALTLSLGCGDTTGGADVVDEGTGGDGALAGTGGAGVTPGAGGMLSGTGGFASSGGAVGTGGALTDGPGAGGLAPGVTFTHPGTLVSEAELSYVKSQLALNKEPYRDQFDSMVNIEKLAQAPTARTTIDANSGVADAARDDARRAFGNALAWHLTGDTVYAERAVAGLNAWAGLTSITANNEQNRLVGGWLGSLLGPAADLMLGYSGWNAEDIQELRDMLASAFYPVLNTASTWNGNVDLHQISAMMSIAVFREDEDEFNLGLGRLEARVPAYFYLTSDPQPNAGVWFNPAKWVDGLTQETCRDNNHHAQFGLSGAIGAMETAYHQGVDVYATYQGRMVATLELMGLQSSSGNMQGTCSNNTTSADVYDTWEIGYNHYHNRMGLALPNTWAMIVPKVRAYESNPGSWSIFYETLTHANIVYP